MGDIDVGFKLAVNFGRDWKIYHFFNMVGLGLTDTVAKTEKPGGSVS